MNSLISIVLPVWNGEKYLEKAINSILYQTYKNFELIIVNDASTDNTNKIIENYVKKDKRIIYIKNDKNKKLPTSLNIGFSYAKGTYYTWTSDDNLLEKNCLEELVNSIKAFDIDIVYSNYKVINEKDEFLSISNVDDAKRLVGGNCIGASFMYKNYVHNNLNGFDVKKFLYEDYDFWVRAYLSNFKFKRLNISPYLYRIHSNQLSNRLNLPIDFIEYRINIIDKFDVSKKIIVEAKISAAKLSYKTKYFFKSFKLFYEALQLAPFYTLQFVMKKIYTRTFKC